jgi:hypothetical protein
MTSLGPEDARESSAMSGLDRQQRLADLPIEKVEAFEKRSAGKLLGKLREQGVESALAVRIEQLIARRNKLVHGFLDDPEVAPAIMNQAAALCGVAGEGSASSNVRGRRVLASHTSIATSSWVVRSYSRSPPGTRSLTPSADSPVGNHAMSASVS